jgi:hypothetical protein
MYDPVLPFPDMEITEKNERVNNDLIVCLYLVLSNYGRVKRNISTN